MLFQVTFPRPEHVGITNGRVLMSRYITEDSPSKTLTLASLNAVSQISTDIRAISKSKLLRGKECLPTDVVKYNSYPGALLVAA